MSATYANDSRPAAPSDNQGAGVESAVLDRYARSAETLEPALCCPTDGYDARYLEMIPQEILEKDYGCGDPSKHVTEGETVVDLGSGAGKICYILAQKVGATGRVVGLDFNDAMLEVARKYADEMAEKLGYRNFTFHKARIQDMGLDLDAAAVWLRDHPIDNVDQLARFREHCDDLRAERPLVANDSVDVIVSNCVLNLVRTNEKRDLFTEMFRLLRRGGRAVISDIVCDEEPTQRIKDDPDLWSGCISGAFLEHQFFEMFEQAGFHGIEVLAYGEQPWQTIDGVEFRSMTVRAYKGKQGPCHERNQAVIYKGPWKQVRDDDGHVYHRGQRMAVCDKTYQLMTDPRGPYAGDVIGIQPREMVSVEEAPPYDCKAAAVRSPRVSKGADCQIREKVDGSACSDGTCC